MIRTSLLIWIALSAGSAQCEQNDALQTLARAKASLHCLAVKLSSIGHAPPLFDGAQYKVQVLYGKYSAIDRPNELHLLVWGAGDTSAAFYETDIEEKGQNFSIQIDQGATFKVVNGALVPDELPGGLAMHQRISRLVKELSSQRPILIDRMDVQAYKCKCSWTP